MYNIFSQRLRKLAFSRLQILKTIQKHDSLYPLTYMFFFFYFFFFCFFFVFFFTKYSEDAFGRMCIQTIQVRELVKEEYSVKILG